MHRSCGGAECTSLFAHVRGGWGGGAAAAAAAICVGGEPKRNGCIAGEREGDQQSNLPGRETGFNQVEREHYREKPIGKQAHNAGGKKDAHVLVGSHVEIFAPGELYSRNMNLNRQHFLASTEAPAPPKTLGHSGFALKLREIRVVQDLQK